MSSSSSHNGHTRVAVTPPTEYADVQKGILLVNVLGLTSALTIVSTVIWPNVFAIIALLLQLAAAVCFCTLYIRIKDGCLLWQYGPGWIKRRVPLSDIKSARFVQRRFSYGRGFHRRGSSALEIVHGGGKRLHLSTPRAEELRLLIDAAPERRGQRTSC